MPWRSRNWIGLDGHRPIHRPVFSRAVFHAYLVYLFAHIWSTDSAFSTHIWSTFAHKRSTEHPYPTDSRWMRFPLYTCMNSLYE